MAKLIICKISPSKCLTRAHKDGSQKGYIPPKRPYGFLAMLDDILDFAALTLVENGRLSFWMPTSNEEDLEIKPPLHPCLVIVSICTQSFNKCKSYAPEAHYLIFTYKLQGHVVLLPIVDYRILRFQGVQ